jgi:hypothetical protein
MIGLSSASAAGQQGHSTSTPFRDGAGRADRDILLVELLHLHADGASVGIVLDGIGAAYRGGCPPTWLTASVSSPGPPQPRRSPCS